MEARKSKLTPTSRHLYKTDFSKVEGVCALRLFYAFTGVRSTFPMFFRASM